jgi:CheY-like chemotaxis protein
MPVKILLADKSITIQKVVEMLFSGKEYSVTAVSDGESALGEASRVLPDVVLADVDLPRLDGYSFGSRLKQNPQLSRTPVILMLSRDDVYDEAKGRQAGIVDHIAKPFESQDLIGKVKTALASAPQRPGEAAAAPRAPARPAAAPPPPTRPQAAVPSDIFDIIQEAPSREEIRRAPAPPAPQEESVYEVEPEVEVEEPMASEFEQALPTGARAREEMREGLGLEEEQAPGMSELEAFGAIPMAEEPVPPPPPPRREAVPPRAPRAAAAAPASVAQPPAVSEEMLRAIAEETIARIAREVLERVAWEVIPQLAEQMIREEIEKLKAETM